MQPIPDETLYSLIARNFERSGFPNWLSYCNHFFNGRAVDLVRPLPAQLELLLPHLSDQDKGLSSAIENLTVFPYYRPFLSQHEYDGFVALSNSYEIHGESSRYAGIIKSRSKQNAKRLRFCSICRREQLSMYGHTAWLRSHQLPAVEVCWRHSVPLFKSDMPRNRAILPRKIIDAQCTKVDSPSDAFWIANASASLLHVPTRHLSASRRRFIYHRAAQRKGFDRGSQVNQRAIADAMRCVWDKATLDRLTPPLGESTYGRWTARILGYQDRATPPLLHLFMIRVLFTDMAAFRNEVDEYLDAISANRSSASS